MINMLAPIFSYSINEKLLLTMLSMHIYCKLQWEMSYRGVYASIFKLLISILYKMLFDTKAPCISDKVRQYLAYTKDWFTSPDGTFIRVFSAYRSLHLLPLFVTDKVVTQEVNYQLATRLSRFLYKVKKS